jgi:hypothetical protein
MTLLDDTLLHTTLSRKNKLPCQKAKSPPQPPVRNIILENNIYEEKKSTTLFQHFLLPHKQLTSLAPTHPSDTPPLTIHSPNKNTRIYENNPTIRGKHSLSKISSPNHGSSQNK